MVGLPQQGILRSNPDNQLFPPIHGRALSSRLFGSGGVVGATETVLRSLFDAAVFKEWYAECQERCEVGHAIDVLAGCLE